MQERSVGDVAMKIVTLNIGTKYAEGDYVGKLYRSLVRNVTVPFEFECITQSEYPGWWGKINVLNPPERIVFLDLDTIITGNVDFLFEYQGSFAILRDFYRPDGFGSAVMGISPGFGRNIVESFALTSKHVMKSFAGDQNFIEFHVKHADLWQDLYPGKIKSFKADNLEAGPKGASIVCLHGQPKNLDLLHLDWVRENWR
jgi:hypothetical protein